MEALALIEHVDRELDLLCLLKHKLEKEHGIHLQIRNFYADAPQLLMGKPPRIVLVPFFYGADDLVMCDYVAAWPDAVYLNLAWEQIFYPSHQSIKQPRGDMAKEKVIHAAWSRTFVDYLSGHGVRSSNARLVGHGLYGLYAEPYRRYFAPRLELAQRLKLDAAKPWVFIPENYRWAFFADNKLRKLSARGVAEADLFQMRSYCRNSLKQLAEWCETLAQTGEVEVIFRPRPATSSREMRRFFAQEAGIAQPSFHLTKAFSAREWVLAAQTVASSYSTVLIEAALAGKEILIAAPEPIPESLRYEWCSLVPQAATCQMFINACSEKSADSGAALKQWAMAQFLPQGDPVRQLTSIIAHETAQAYTRPAPVKVLSGKTLPAWAAALASVLPPKAKHRLCQVCAPGYAFNAVTHEKDLFSSAETRRRTAKWASIVRPEN